MKEEMLPVLYKNGSYDKIVRFDCVIIELGYNDGLGGFFTVIPISSIEYRKEHPTKCAIEIERFLDYTVFVIFDDWGDRYVINIPNTMQSQIDSAIESAKAKEIHVKFMQEIQDQLY